MCQTWMILHYLSYKPCDDEQEAIWLLRAVNSYIVFGSMCNVKLVMAYIYTISNASKITIQQAIIQKEEDGHQVELIDDTKKWVNLDGKLMKGWQGLGYDGPYIGEGQA